jgi:hypothetical protein
MYKICVALLLSKFMQKKFYEVNPCGLYYKIVYRSRLECLSLPLSSILV